MLKRLYQQIVKKAGHAERGALVAVGSAFLLTGCMQGGAFSLKASDKVDESILASASAEGSNKTQADSKQHVDAPTMYQILVAEMMVQKGYDLDAFNVIFALANKRRDAGLAKRAFQLSMKTFDVNKVEAATALWRELSPQSDVAWRASFLISLRKDEVTQAIKQWQRFQEISVESFDQDMVTTAQRVAVSTPRESGVTFFKELSEIYADRWSAHYALAISAEAYGELQIALAASERAKVLQTVESEAQINQLLAKLYLQVGPAEKGLESLEAYLNKYPDDWLVQERVARLEVQADRYEAASKRYKEILASVPDAYTSRLSLSLIQIEKRLYDEAKANLLKVVEKDGYTEVASYYLGLIYQELNEDETALSYFERVKSDSYYIDAQLHRAEIYFAASQAEKALEVLDNVDAKTPKDKVKVYRAKGVFYSLGQQNTLAIEQYQKALEIDSENVEVLMSQALLFYNSGQYDRYEANLKRVIEIRPNDVNALNALGYLYVENNQDLKEAESMLNKAYELAPDSYYVLDSLGWLYYQQKNYDLAEKFLLKAHSIQLDDEILIHLITVYWKQGKQQEAKTLWLKNHQKFLKNEKLQGLIKQLELE